MYIFKKKNFLTLIIGSIIIFLVIFFISWQFLRNVNYSTEKLMAEDIKKLSNIFSSINDCCGIVGFKKDKIDIDFLNVKDFVGTEIGGMVLKNPQYWKGAYLTKPLNMQNKDYQIVKVQEGYFIIPGDGVKLSNNKIIGKDFEVNKNIKLTQNFNDFGLQTKDGQILAEKIPTSENAFQKLDQDDFIDSEDFTEY